MFNGKSFRAYIFLPICNSFYFTASSSLFCSITSYTPSLPPLASELYMGIVPSGLCIPSSTSPHKLAEKGPLLGSCSLKCPPPPSAFEMEIKLKSAFWQGENRR